MGWFSRLEEAERSALLKSASRRKFKAGTFIVHRGAAADELYVVIGGKLKAGVTLLTGRDTTFDIVGPDEVFGEIGLFAGGHRSADVVAVEDCELFVLRRPDLLLALRTEPAIATTLLQVMAERIISLSAAIEDASSLDAGARLARCLVKLAERFGVQPAPQNLQVQVKLSQQDLADLVGVSRVFANGKLKGWERDGILTHRSGRLTIHNLPALRQAAGLSLDTPALDSIDGNAGEPHRH